MITASTTTPMPSESTAATPSKSTGIEVTWPAMISSAVFGAGVGRLLSPRAQPSRDLFGAESDFWIRAELLDDRRGRPRMPDAVDARQRPRIAVASLAGVARDGGDEGPKIDLRGIEQDEDVAGRRAGVNLSDARSSGDTRLETGGTRGPAADALDAQTRATANGDEDDLDGGRGGRHSACIGDTGQLASLCGRE